jgi:glucose-1-phosphate cytidylyltransferase
MSSPDRCPVFILAGGLGTRISEETDLKPKPMIEIGDSPILLHIMRWYFSFGFNDFVICAGYKSWEIKRYFLHYEALSNHLEIDHRTQVTAAPKSFGKNVGQENWRVRVIDTGTAAMTGARVAKAFDLVQSQEPFDQFALTYGDGLTDVNLLNEFKFHRSHKKIGTVLGVRNQARYGELDVTNDSLVEGFLEKPESRQGHINGAYFFFKSDFRKYLDVKDDHILERTPLSSLAARSLWPRTAMSALAWRAWPSVRPY